MSNREGPSNSNSPQLCSNNWLLTNVCQYTQTVPVDPLNGNFGNVVGSTISPPGTTWGDFRYHLKMSGSDYKIFSRLESKSNVNEVVNDGGIHEWETEVFSNKDIF